jgi:hypothetical protein
MRHFFRAACLATFGAFAVAAPPLVAAASESAEVMIGQVFITNIVGTGCTNAVVGNNFTLTLQPPLVATDLLRFSTLSGISGATYEQTQSGSSTLQQSFVKIDGTGPGVHTPSFSGYSFVRSPTFRDSGEFTITLAFSTNCIETWRATVTDWPPVSQ